MVTKSVMAPDTYEQECQNATFPTVSVIFQANFIIKKLVMGKHFEILFYLPKFKKLSDTLIFFLTEDHMWLEISKRYCSYCGYILPLISAEIHEDVACHGRMEAVILLGNRHMAL